MFASHTKHISKRKKMLRHSHKWKVHVVAVFVNFVFTLSHSYANVPHTYGRIHRSQFRFFFLCNFLILERKDNGRTQGKNNTVSEKRIGNNEERMKREDVIKLMMMMVLLLLLWRLHWKRNIGAKNGVLSAHSCFSRCSIYTYATKCEYTRNYF